MNTYIYCFPSCWVSMALYSDLHLRAIQGPDDTCIAHTFKTYINVILSVCYSVVLGDTEFLLLYAMLGMVCFLHVSFDLKSRKLPLGREEGLANYLWNYVLRGRAFCESSSTPLLCVRSMRTCCNRLISCQRPLG